MSEIITFPLPTGANYVIPDVGDENWGQNVTNFLVAIPAGVMPTSGTFSLTGDVSFGPTFGLVSQYFKSATVNPASTGFLRLAKTDLIEWRNNANSADLPLTINGSDQLTFNGAILTTGTTGNLTDVGTDGIVVTGGTGAVIGSGTSIAQQVATSTQNGYLSSTDWSTFNNKGSGSVTSVNLTVPAFLSISGSPITTSGTLAISLSGTALPVANGGTGDTSFTTFSVICGGTTSTNPLQSVASVGASGQFLQSQGPGLLPTWANVSGSGTVNSGTATQLAYYAASSNTVSSAAGITTPSSGNLVAGNNIKANSFTTGAFTAVPDQVSVSHLQAYDYISIGSAAQLTFQVNGSGPKETWNITIPAANQTYTVPDVGGNTDFLLSAGTQTVTGVKTFSGGSGAITMSGSTIAMSSNKITGLASGTASADAATFGQLQLAVPPGVIQMYGAASAPSGWLLCNGTAVSRTTFAALFAIVGTTFGVGDGSTTFNVPNLTNNVPVGSGSIAALGATAGAQTHSVTTSEMPTHSHGITDPGHGHTLRGSSSGGAGAVQLGDSNANAVAALALSTGGASYTNTGAGSPGSGLAYVHTSTTGITTGNAGSGTAMSLVQPSIGLTFIIKT